MLAKRVAVVSPAGPEGPRRLAAAGADRILVLAAGFAASPRVDVWAGPLGPTPQLPLRDGSVDAVLCIESYAALEPDGRAVLVREARRVLRPAGVVAVWSAQRASTEAELQVHFPHVAALGQQRWTGVSLAPVADVPAPGLRLVEDLLLAPPQAGPYLVVASAGELATLLRDCVIVPTAGEATPAQGLPVSAAAQPVESRNPVPLPAPLAVLPAAVSAEQPHSAMPGVPGVPAPPAAPSDPADELDMLAALFEAPTPNMAGAAPTVPPPAPSAELAALRQQLATLGAEREGLLQKAQVLAQELTQAQAQTIDAQAELHELRRRTDPKSRPEVDEGPPLKSEHEPVAPHDSSLLTRVLVDEVAPIVTAEPPRPSADVALDRDRLREELTRRTADLQELETRLWQSEEEVQKERLENVRLVTDVDRLREQVDRSRVVEHERVQELERLGHELRKLELMHAELQGLLNTRDQRLRELEASGGRGEHPPEIEALQVQVREFGAQRDQSQALERAASDLARRRERELAEAAKTVRELRRNLEEHASVAANLRGELAVMQVEVEQYGATMPRLQERLRDQQRKTLAREEEAADLQRRLEHAIGEQQQLRQRLRRYKQELEAVASARDGTEVELYRARSELEARRKVVEQLQQIVALGATGGRVSSADEGAELHALRALLTQQASEHAEQLARSEQQHRQMVEGERERLKRLQLEATIRGEEQEYLLYQLDTAEQRIWEMTDATDRGAARLAAGLAQLEKQKEQYEDLIDQLEVTRNLLAEAQAQIVELDRQLASERTKLARLTIEPGVRIDIVEDDESQDTSAFDILMDDPGGRDEDSGMEVAPPIHRDPAQPDPLAGIDFDEDEESIAVRLAGSSFELTGAFDSVGVQIDLDEDDGPGGVVLPSDMRVQIDLDEDDEEPVTQPPPAATPKVLRTLPFLDDDEEDVFAIDTDQIELATPTPPPPSSDRPGFDQKFTDHSNSRIVIEILEDEAWPEESGEPKS